MNTPEFLVWAIEYRCPIRGFQDGANPERTERQLRAARAYFDARQAGRVFEGLCVDPPNGFWIDAALDIYGGLPTVEQNCFPCPANSTPGRLAGCYGLLPVYESLHQMIESMPDRRARCESLFSCTSPRWYGLWLQSPLGREQLAFLAELFELPEVREQGPPEMREILAGLNTALRGNMRLHATLFPPGSVEGPWWRLVSHCPRCKAAWSSPDSRECRTCGFVGHPAPYKKRHARGRRPYFPLAQLLGEQEAAAFLVRYEAFRKQPGSQAPVETPLLSERPDNRPAG